MQPANFRVRPYAPAPAAFGAFPQYQHANAANLTPELNAFNHVNLSRIQHPMPGPPTPSGPTITYAPPLVDDKYDPTSDTLDRVGPSLDNISHAATPGKTPMVPKGSYSHDQLGVSKGNWSKDGFHHQPRTTASDHMAGSRSERPAKFALTRLFSKAAIYPYASQGLSCQGTDLSVLSSTAGGTT
jgi:hypothetical protein